MQKIQKIITSAIATGTGAGVDSLPNYLYVTSNVYRTRSSVGIYIISKIKVLKKLDK